MCQWSLKPSRTKFSCHRGAAQSVQQEESDHSPWLTKLQLPCSYKVLLSHDIGTFFNTSESWTRFLTSMHCLTLIIIGLLRAGISICSGWYNNKWTALGLRPQTSFGGVGHVVSWCLYIKLSKTQTRGYWEYLETIWFGLCGQKWCVYLHIERGSEIHLQVITGGAF